MNSIPLKRSIHRMTLRDKFLHLHWGLIGLLVLLSAVGVSMLYSVSDGNFGTWATRQMVWCVLGFFIMFVIALSDLRLWFMLAYPLFGFTLSLLIAVELFGVTNMGAQRWLDFTFFQLQPADLMRLSLVLALARYYHNLPVHRVSHILWLITPCLMIILPAGLIFHQPDLGTAILFILTGAGILFLCNVSWIYFVFFSVSLVPVVLSLWWNLHAYQKQRVLTFLNPENDPLGAGYQILQSKIAIGSGGTYGKGLLKGTQSHLNFLPEQHTDFIFTMFAEEMGFVGCVILLLLYISIVLIGYSIMVNTRNYFGRIISVGVCWILFIYVFVNIAMVTGLLPVVGVPLPFLSYGGTAFISMMIGMGLLLNVHINRNMELGIN